MFTRLLFFSLFTIITCGILRATEVKEVKVVIVSLFEIGESTGDKPGEFQYWVEKFPLPESVSFPHGDRDLRWNEEKGVLGIVTGIGTAKAAASIMALGLDPRFDFSNAYWLLVGISGYDPEDASLASACWIDWVIDGDLSHSIDIREAPAGWTTGRFPFRSSKPYQQPKPGNEGSYFHLNEQLTDWAYALTKDIDLGDTEALQQRRALHTDHPNAQRPPFVLKGSYLAAMNYWHGAIETQWANEWVKYWTDGDGEFVASAMEGTGMMTAITYLEKAKLVQSNRVMMLRTASNFTMQWPGATAIESKKGETIGGYSAFIPSLESAYKVGSPVVNELVNHWETYKDSLPSAKPHQ